MSMSREAAHAAIVLILSPANEWRTTPEIADAILAALWPTDERKDGEQDESTYDYGWPHPTSSESGTAPP